MGWMMQLRIGQSFLGFQFSESVGIVQSITIRRRTAKGPPGGGKKKWQANEIVMARKKEATKTTTMLCQWNLSSI
jgi:hypothetical protein